MTWTDTVENFVVNVPHPACDQRSQQPWEEVVINSTGQEEWIGAQRAQDHVDRKRWSWDLTPFLSPRGLSAAFDMGLQGRERSSHFRFCGGWETETHFQGTHDCR